MRTTLAFILLTWSLQAGPLNGLGFSSKTCVDLDGDGYGTGPLASLITTSSTAVSSPGVATVTLGSVSGLQLYQRLRYDANSGTGENLEFVTITAISGSTITANFLIAHASGVSVSAGTAGDGSLWFPGYPHDDPGCLGLDADDRDSTVQTAAQGITKYGSLALFLAKLGRDWQTLEWDTAADQTGTPDSTTGCTVSAATQCSAAAAMLTNNAHTYYVAPASPSAGCTGTTGQCSGVDTTSCGTLAAPCLTISGLITYASYGNTGVGGDLILARDGWNNNNTNASLYSGASTRYNGLWSYPGEHGIMTYQIKLGPPSSCGSPTQQNYIWVDGMRLMSTASHFGGSITGGSCVDTSPGQNHDVIITHNNGTESDPGGLAPLTAFNAINNWTIAYNTFHDDNCPSSCNTPHGIYLGDHDTTQSTYTTLRRNLVYRNSDNGLHWNGHATGFYIDQNAAYDNGITGLDMDSGVVNSYIRSNVVFNNDKQIGFEIYNGACGMGDSGPCPGNVTGNLIENNTIYSTGNANISSPGSNPDSGCSAGVNYCNKPALFFLNITSPATGNFGSNTLRNNIFGSYGNSNGNSEIWYTTDTSTLTCGTTCQGWASADTYDHNQFWQSDGKGSSSTAKILWVNGYTTLSTSSGVTTFTNNAFGDPKTVAETISQWNNESYFDFRLIPASPALNAGSTTGIPDYDGWGRAFVEVAPSIGALERNLYSQGWKTLTGAGLSSAVAPPVGSPLDSLNGSITSSSTNFTVTIAAQEFVGNILVIDNEAMCINGVSGTTITIGVNAQCSGTTSGNGRGWAGSTAASHSNGATIYLNTIQGGGTQGTTPSAMYPFKTQYQQMNTLGAGWDGVARDIAGQSKQLSFWGGGHSNYVGNEVYSIFPNLTTPSISIISGPSVFAIPGFDGVGTWGYNSTAALDAQLVDGTPNVAHIEANIAYGPWADTFYKFGGSYAGGNGFHSYDTFSFAYSTNTWSRYSGATHDVDCTNHGTGYTNCVYGTNGRQNDPIGDFGGSGFSGLATADPFTQTIWELWNSSGGASVLTQYYPAVHQHVQRADNQPTVDCCGNSTEGMNRVLISDRRWIFLNALNSTLSNYKIDISGVTSQTPTASPNPATASVTVDSSCNAGALGTTSPGLTFIPQISRVLIFPANTGGNTYYLMDPGNWTCTSYTVSGGPPASPTNPYIAGTMQYFPSLDATLLVDDIGANTPRVLSLSAGDPTTAINPATQTYSGSPIGAGISIGAGVTQ